MSPCAPGDERAKVGHVHAKPPILASNINNQNSSCANKASAFSISWFVIHPYILKHDTPGPVFDFTKYLQHNRPSPSNTRKYGLQAHSGYSSMSFAKQNC